MNLHHPFGVDWGDWVAIFTLIGAVATYANLAVSRTAKNSNRPDFEKLAASIVKLNETMVKVNMALDSLKADRESTNRRLDKIEATSDRHDIQLARIEEHVMTQDSK
ncbi:hypothetical protein QSU93_02790 [Limosilactobacillus fermentum]|uniref:hypothetical protein n=1 Tax=Limosilactobacillus fermentum TaxID=1613 RepID=UPI00256FFB51|nr:hypothetical protein [Limosilactobacillus fermentum]WJD85322.1 hypothetical protein QSU93_02790 [Limosilactobacillus fermentum]